MLGAAAPPTRKAQAKDGDCDQISRARLSKRQLEVLKLLGEGRTNAEIARTLFRSPNTIKLHVSAILHRLKLKSRTQAALLAATMPRAESAR
jgi:DNA-binding NarL/FixJ family response regulator